MVEELGRPVVEPVVAPAGAPRILDDELVALDPDDASRVAPAAVIVNVPTGPSTKLPTEPGWPWNQIDSSVTLPSVQSRGLVNASTASEFVTPPALAYDSGMD